MNSAEPEVSVVVATRNRAGRLAELLAALRAQSLSAERFEVIVVDDGSGDGTAATLKQGAEQGGLALRWFRHDRPTGPAIAREEGWRAARAPLIAFTDDDCAPAPGWLEAAVAAARENPGAIVQGATLPMPWELHRSGLFSRTNRVTSFDPYFRTCNVLYPRELLERVDGFDTDAFAGPPSTEDADLGWRAVKAGAPSVFAPKALVYHAVNRLGPIGTLRLSGRGATPGLLSYGRHAELRRATFAKGIFYNGSHYLLVRTLIALLLPRPLAWLAPWLAGPYLLEVTYRSRDRGAGPLLAPYFVLYDLIELVAVARAAIRYRIPAL
ncbi:MAG: glycosyltransferase family 2 protein [Solirubrobacterales bacterium]